jgi:1-deoxy-D-xylulose-5-phosphate reductoisomerase
MACTINAANEIAVQAFLDNKLKFLQISEVIEQCTQKIAFIAQPTIDDYIETDFEARNIAIEIIKNIK